MRYGSVPAPTPWRFKVLWLAPPAPSPRGVRGCGPTRPRRAGQGRRRVVLLPFVANAAQLHPTTRLPYVTNWLVSWGGIECARGSEYLADVGMPEGPDPAVEALQELVDRVPHPRRATPAAGT